ncbi:hypothetical protein X801_05127, partial [Opisthorchis viverrini]
MHKLGLVNIDLELGDRKLQLDVTPLQASVAYLFTLRRSWNVRDLAQLGYILIDKRHRSCGHYIFNFQCRVTITWGKQMAPHRTRRRHGVSGFECTRAVFQRLKGNRTLRWMHKLGLVNIDLELGDRKLQLDVTPLQASVAYLFTLRRSWNVRDLAQ